MFGRYSWAVLVKRRFRLASSSDFQRVRRSGRSFAHPLAVLVVAPNSAQNSRCAFIVAKFLGKAVVRNRLKRRMRAAMLFFWPRIPPGWDLVMIARKPSLHAAHLQILNALATLLRRAELLKESDDLGSR